MDAKSLAKSKSAHSLHHNKKPHSIQKPKAASGGSSGDAGSGNKALGKQVKEKALQSALPSNCDRYEEEEFEGSSEPSGESINKATDVSLPKSKGAHYRHVIVEVQHQHHSPSSLDSSLSLDDIFPGDFKIGVGPILSVRGEAILSWIGDDNFVVEDERSGNPEASFLSLNLNALAEQLEKVNLPERLFIEADLLPPELLEDQRGTTVDRLESDQVQQCVTESRTEFEELALEDLSKENKAANQNTELLQSSQSSVNIKTNSDPFKQQSDVINQTIGDLNSKPASQLVHGGAMGTPTVWNSRSVEAPSKKTSTFKATAAEEELDKLLDSFKETKFLDSPDDALSVSQEVAQPQLTRSAPSFSRTETFAAELDGVLDDLLEKSSSSSSQNVSGHLGKATATSKEIQCSSSRAVSKSKVLDDFDSWLGTF